MFWGRLWFHFANALHFLQAFSRHWSILRTGICSRSHCSSSDLSGYCFCWALSCTSCWGNVLLWLDVVCNKVAESLENAGTGSLLVKEWHRFECMISVDTYSQASEHCFVLVLNRCKHLREEVIHYLLSLFISKDLLWSWSSLLRFSLIILRSSSSR